MKRFFRALLLVVGALSIVLGLWWFAQGTGLAPIGFMAHHMQWAWRGIGLVVGGVIIAIISRRM